MSHNNIPAGFHPIERQDSLFAQQVYDPYVASGKLHEPSVCPQCHACFHQGRWQWINAPADARHVTCPACHRIHDRYPAGFLTLEGPFFHDHKAEIMQLVKHYEHRERTAHPIKRIMAVEDADGAVTVTTTDIHLARGIGEAVHHAFQGELELHYNPHQSLLRVHWAH